MVVLDFLEIVHRLKAMEFPRVDRVVGVATGGIVPASLVAYQLERPLSLVHINYRAPDNTPRYPAPQLLAPPALDSPGEPPERILLVDDVSVTGQTLALARRQFPHSQVITFVLKGQADYVLFPEIASCVQWPWKLDRPGNGPVRPPAPIEPIPRTKTS